VNVPSPLPICQIPGPELSGSQEERSERSNQICGFVFGFAIWSGNVNTPETSRPAIGGIYIRSSTHKSAEGLEFRYTVLPFASTLVRTATKRYPHARLFVWL